jgi:hypothetical protein
LSKGGKVKKYAMAALGFVIGLAAGLGLVALSMWSTAQLHRHTYTASRVFLAPIVLPIIGALWMYFTFSPADEKDPR